MDEVLKVAARAAHYARILRAMSIDEAKETLGFRPNQNPSQSEINKAYRAKALENHPDRGGNPEKMVEVNVAKDILEGKVNPRKTSPKKDPGMDPAEVARRKAEIKKRLDIGRIEISMEKAERAMGRALSDLDGVVGAAWRADLKEFLVNDYADVIDRLHDEATAGKHADMDKAEKLATSLSATALRLSSRFASLNKALAQVRDEATVEKVAELYKEVTKFVAAFKTHRTESGKLMSLIATSDNVPLQWDDLYSKSHQRIIAYDEDFQRFSPSGLKALESQVEMSVDGTEMLLESEYGIKGKFPEWKKWRVPADFRDAIEIITKAN